MHNIQTKTEMVTQSIKEHEATEASIYPIQNWSSEVLQCSICAKFHNLCFKFVEMCQVTYSFLSESNFNVCDKSRKKRKKTLEN